MVEHNKTTDSLHESSVLKLLPQDVFLMEKALSHLRISMRTFAKKPLRFVENKLENIDENKSPLMTYSPSTGLLFSSSFSSFSHAKNVVENYYSQIMFSTPFLLREGVRTFDNNTTYFQDGTKCSLLYEIPRENENPKLNLMNLFDINNHQVKSDYIVEDFLEPEMTGMFLSAPGKYKSLVALYMSLQIASGGTFLGRDCSQTGVLYFDAENNMSILKERINKLTKGMDKDIPFFIGQELLLINQKKQIQKENIEELKILVQKKNIGLVVFDTLHRFCYYDENSSDDINLVYMEAFKPLLKLGVSIIFLHHTTKDNKYRGSGDLLGQLDVSYKFDTKTKTKKGGIFTITNEKNRKGEIDNIKAEIIFTNDEIKFEVLSKDVESESEKSKKEQSKKYILEYLETNTEGISRKELLESMKEFDIGRQTHDRALKELKEEKKIKMLSNKYFFNGSKSKISKHTSGHPSISYNEIIKNKQLEKGDIVEMPSGNYIRGDFK